MNQDGYDIISRASVQPGFGDARQSPRFAILIRSAKLVTGVGEFLCIVRDISETGIRLRFFHPIPHAAAASLALPTSESIGLVKVWENGEQAGFRFHEPIDVENFVAEEGPFPKRPLRLNIPLTAAIRFGDQAHAAMVHDISQHGARVNTSAALALGQTVFLEAEGWPGVYATVCWRRNGSYGVVFRTQFSLREFAIRAAQAQLGNAYILG
jgi:hypothetical protein